VYIAAISTLTQALSIARKQIDDVETVAPRVPIVDIASREMRQFLPRTSLAN